MQALFTFNGFLVLVALLAVAAFAGYRWYQTARTLRIHKWVRQYLADRYGSIPESLSINSSEDEHWPVLVAFRTEGGQTRHRLQFSCGGATSRWALRSQIDEPMPLR